MAPAYCRQTEADANAPRRAGERQSLRRLTPQGSKPPARRDLGRKVATAGEHRRGAKNFCPPTSLLPFGMALHTPAPSPRPVAHVGSPPAPPKAHAAKTNEVAASTLRGRCRLAATHPRTLAKVHTWVSPAKLLLTPPATAAVGAVVCAYYGMVELGEEPAGWATSLVKPPPSAPEPGTSYVLARSAAYALRLTVGLPLALCVATSAGAVGACLGVGLGATVGLCCGLSEGVASVRESRWPRPVAVCVRDFRWTDGGV